MKKIYCLLMAMTFALCAAAQTKVVGTVLDDAGIGAIGATVVAEGTTVGTVTDFDGFFELTVPAGVKNIVISYVGYKTVTTPVKPEIKVTLQSDAEQLEEVVVTGMVKQDKRLFTGATTKLEADETMLSGVADVSRSLEGRAAGVSVQNVSGTFGTAPKIRVRGATSIYGASKPLWVVDGVVLEDAIEMDADEFAQFACKYASEIDCSITGKSMLALYERIEMMEEDGVRLTQKAAVDLIEEAADKAEKKTLGRKLTSIFSPAYDKEGFLILREKDFFD